MDFSILRWIVVAAQAVLIILFLVHALNPNSRFGSALRDSGPHSSFSFSKVQLFWWIMIISLCFSLAYAQNGTVDGVINTTALVLLGISLGTTAAGLVVDNSEKGNPTIVRHQEVRPVHGFFADILSDHNGVNLHRFQAFLFNVLYGLIFVIQFAEGSFTAFPYFDNLTLALLGISSAGYIGLKTGENSARAAPSRTTVTPTITEQPVVVPPTTPTPPAPADPAT